MLLIDEPEIALHPNGIRAASNYLYDLSKDGSWQVMLTTHSPLFINPFEDNTTIVRLKRDEGSPAPNTYRSDAIEFSQEEKERLTLLNTFDQNLAEMFFGQYPIIVEGDTEFAAFHRIMSLNEDKYPLGTRPLLIRARGKFTIIPIIKMLRHFKVDFSILHDSDYPKTKNGNKNGSWKANSDISDELKICRVNGQNVIHRISFSTFEIQHLELTIDEAGIVKNPSRRSKPFKIYSEIIEDDVLKGSVEQILDELLDLKSNSEPFREKTADHLKAVFSDWVNSKNIKDQRFII